MSVLIDLLIHVSMDAWMNVVYIDEVMNMPITVLISIYTRSVSTVNDVLTMMTKSMTVSTRTMATPVVQVTQSMNVSTMIVTIIVAYYK